MKERYLDQIIKYSDRVNVTRLRISADRLQKELGRYNKIAKEDRLCSWCKLVLGVETIEDEEHFLQYCDLNATPGRNIYHKIRSLTTNTPHTTTTTSAPVSHTQNIPQSINYLKFISNNSELSDSLINESQVHLKRMIAGFVTTCIKNRNKFIDSLPKS